jgi:hypothetical protein
MELRKPGATLSLKRQKFTLLDLGGVEGHNAAIIAIVSFPYVSRLNCNRLGACREKEATWAAPICLQITGRRKTNHS